MWCWVAGNRNRNHDHRLSICSNACARCFATTLPSIMSNWTDLTYRWMQWNSATVPLTIWLRLHLFTAMYQTVWYQAIVLCHRFIIRTIRAHWRISMERWRHRVIRICRWKTITIDSALPKKFPCWKQTAPTILNVIYRMGTSRRQNFIESATWSSSSSFSRTNQQCEEEIGARNPGYSLVWTTQWRLFIFYIMNEFVFASTITVENI